MRSSSVVELEIDSRSLRVDGKWAHEHDGRSDLRSSFEALARADKTCALKHSKQRVWDIDNDAFRTPTECQQQRVRYIPSRSMTRQTSNVKRRRRCIVEVPLNWAVVQQCGGALRRKEQPSVLPQPRNGEEARRLAFH